MRSSCVFLPFHSVQKMRTFFFLLLVVCTHVCGCFIKVHKPEKRAFTANGWCYDHKSENQASGKIRFDGYYSDSSKYHCIFYSDGFWVAGNLNSLTTTKDMSAVMPFGIYKWGVYRIADDTIKIRYLFTPQRPYVTWHSWFLIENTETLTHLISTRNFPITESMLQAEQGKSPDGRKFTFIQGDSLPDMNLSWFKRCKWLWCDKAAFETWKTSMK